MFDMVLNSITLFLRGRLFKDVGMVMRQVGIGALVTAVLCLLLWKLGLPFGVAILISAFAGGMLQPWLFKDLKYA